MEQPSRNMARAAPAPWERVGRSPAVPPGKTLVQRGTSYQRLQLCDLNVTFCNRLYRGAYRPQFKPCIGGRPF